MYSITYVVLCISLHQESGSQTQLLFCLEFPNLIAERPKFFGGVQTVAENLLEFPPTYKKHQNIFIISKAKLYFWKKRI